MKKTGVDCIAEVKSAPKDKHLSSMFPDTKAVTAREFSRPYISVHVVLGMESRSLNYRDGYEGGNLMLNTSIFASGRILTGQAQAVVSRRIPLEAKTP